MQVQVAHARAHPKLGATPCVMGTRDPAVPQAWPLTVCHAVSLGKGGLQHHRETSQIVDREGEVRGLTARSAVIVCDRGMVWPGAQEGPAAGRASAGWKQGCPRDKDSLQANAVSLGDEIRNSLGIVL